MKKLKQNLSFLAVLVFILHFSFSVAFGQAPHFMSYQAVVRNSSNALVTNAPVAMRVSILQGSATGTAVFVETHATTTNANGLATIEIGNGTAVDGSMATMVWTAGPFFIKTETDPNGGTDYSITGVSQLLSVPYALYAETSGSSTAGPQGPVGPAGAAGADGPMGPQGVAGETGAQGLIGLTGADGPMGLEGPMGPVGLTGAEGPMGPAGAQGEAGPMGPAGPAGSGGMSVNCLECHNHNPATATGLAKELENAKNEIEYSKHSEGAELSISEGGSAGCAPCHSHEGMHSVVDNNVVPTMVLGTNGKYSFSYNATTASSSGLTTMPGKIGCWTCHKGAATDSMALYTTAPIQMTMYPIQGTNPGKIINITQHNGESNLCVKCHQPRPMTTSTTLSNGASVDYNDLANNPGNLFFSITVGNAAPNKLVPSYRMHNHYGAIGGIFAAQAGVQFPGALAYDNTSTHATVASCQTCHMATPTGTNGGHSFYVSSVSAETGSKTYNFKGCNTSGCHSTMSATNSTFTGTRANTTDLLMTIADKLRTPDGLEIMHKNPDAASNIFAGVTTAGYDGYLDIYDPSTNPLGAIRNPAPATSWTTDQKNLNLSLPLLGNLLNVQMGAIINFQLSVREYSLGIHNPAYSQALLNNTIDALTAAGF